MITVIRLLYHHSECSVIVTEEFSGFSFHNLKILILPMTWLFSPQSTSIWKRKEPLPCYITSGWKHYSLRTNIRPYKSNVKLGLLSGLYGVLKSDGKWHEISFHRPCLRKVSSISWPEKISNKQLYKKTSCCGMVVLEIKLCWMWWLWHVLRTDQEQIARAALIWTPPLKREKGRPKTRGGERCHLN